MTGAASENRRRSLSSDRRRRNLEPDPSFGDLLGRSAAVAAVCRRIHRLAVRPHDRAIELGDAIGDIEAAVRLARLLGVALSPQRRVAVRTAADARIGVGVPAGEAVLAPGCADRAAEKHELLQSLSPAHELRRRNDRAWSRAGSAARRYALNDPHRRARRADPATWVSGRRLANEHGALRLMPARGGPSGTTQVESGAAYRSRHARSPSRPRRESLGKTKRSTAP